MSEIKIPKFSPVRPSQTFSKDLALFYSLPKCVIHTTLPEKNTLSTFLVKTHTFPINHSTAKQFSADSWHQTISF